MSFNLIFFEWERRDDVPIFVGKPKTRKRLISRYENLEAI